MPIRIRYQNDDSQECTIRPTPLVSISTNILKNGAGEAFGVNYTITLTGSILADQGTPYARDTNGVRYGFFGNPPPTPDEVGPYGAFDSTGHHFADNRPTQQQITARASSNAIFFKQQVLRALFAQDGQRMEISDFYDDEPTVLCHPRLVGDISFSEGVYVDRAEYTITLEADTLLNKNLIVNSEGSLAASDGSVHVGHTEEQLLASLSGAFIADYTEDWSIEVDDALGESTTSPRSYRVTHTLSSTGKTHYNTNGISTPAWEQARNFVQRKLSNGVTDYPNVMGSIGSGTISLVSSYGGFNHVRTEQIGESAGSYGVTETWLLSSGTSYENYSMSTTTSTDSPFISVSIDGNIKGLSQIAPSGFTSANTARSAYDNALTKYNVVTNSGQFGVGSDMYKRSNNLVAVQLNSQPKSITLGSNPYNGEISYNLQFDNRPTNIISGVLAESISVNDTYPGDVFAVIPVLGRAQGPILQYIGGRTEYRRDISIDLIMDYTDIPYGKTRSSLMLKKPSVVEPTATQLGELIAELSPSGEPGVRKYFISPPTESWQPKNGIYNLNLSWTYELSR